MSRLPRILLISALIAALTAGSALAGPGANSWSGDPEIPEIANPHGKKIPVEVLEPESMATGSGLVEADMVPRVVQPMSWRIALKVYLKLARIFSF